MKLFTKIQKKETRKLPMTGKVKKGFRYYCAAVLNHLSKATAPCALKVQ